MLVLVGGLWGCQTPSIEIASAPVKAEPALPSAPEPVPAAVTDLLEAWNHGGGDYPEHEKRALVGVPARRNGDTLFLTLTNGRERRYKSVTTHCELDDEKHCYYYYLVAYLRGQGTFLVSYSRFEDQTYMLVDAKTGTAVEIPDYPKVSPSQIAIATEEEALEPVLQIWRKTAQGWINEFRLKPEDPGGDLYTY